MRTRPGTELGAELLGPGAQDRLERVLVDEQPHGRAELLDPGVEVREVARDLAAGERLDVVDPAVRVVLLLALAPDASSSPAERRISTVRSWKWPARGWIAVPVCRSTARQLTPCSRRNSAVDRPTRLPPTIRTSGSSLMARERLHRLQIVSVQVVRGRVLHHARDVVDELIAVPRPAEQVEAHLHPRGDPAGGHDPPGVDHARPADPAGRRDVGQAVDRHLAGGAGLDLVRLLAVGRRQAVEQPHPPVHPRAGAHAGQQRLLVERADELVQAAVVHLLAGAEPARDQERVHRRPVVEAVVREHREPGLGLDRAHRVGDQERVELGVIAARHRPDAVGRGEIDDLRVLEHVDPQPETWHHRLLSVDHLG